MRKYFTFIIIGFISIAQAFTPQPGSPLALKQHPRMHITQATISKFRDAIAANFLNYYQEYVDWAYSQDDNNSKNVLYEAGHDPLTALMVHQALIAALGTVPGISYPGTLDNLAQRAVNSLIRRLDAGDKLSYVAPLTYDWTYNFMTESQRQQIADKMLNRTITHIELDNSIANPTAVPVQMFSSRYFEGCYPWYVALAFWGDGLIDNDANKALDTFHEQMTNFGYMDAMNFVAGNDGGWPEWIGYASWHPRTHILNVDAWRTATGENYIGEKGDVDGNALINYPRLMFHALDPHKYFDRHYTFIRSGDASTTDASFEHGSMREQMYLLPRVLNDAGYADMAGLVSYIIDEYDVMWEKYEHRYIWEFLGIYKAISPRTPDELGFKKSLWARNMGTFFARTGYQSPADGVFVYNDGHFRFEGHKGAEETPGFALAKFGTLVNTRHVAHRGYGNLNDYPGAREYNIVYFDGGHTDNRGRMTEPPDLEKAYNGQGDFDSGGIEQITRKEEYFYYVRSNRNRVLDSGYTNTRELVWLPGSDPVNESDFLVVYDRSQSPTEAEWVYHVPWKPMVNDYTSSEDITTGSGKSDRIGTRYLGREILVKEQNSIGGEQDNEKGTEDYVGGGNAHGVAFCKTILPQDIRVEVSRVAKFDNDVLNRQAHLAIKSHRWQISVFAKETQSTNRFLHVFQTADADKVTSMAPNSLIEVGNAMQGVWIEKESSGRPNYVVLFNKEPAINEQVITYTVNGSGLLRNVITGVKPFTNYKIEDIHNSNTTTNSKVTEPDMQLWDYKGQAANTTIGTLYFETTINGSHTYKITISGEQDTTPPSKPTGLKTKGRN